MTLLSKLFLSQGDDRPVAIVKILVVLGFLGGIILSYHLWWGIRLIPYVPLVPFHAPLWLHNLLAVAFASSLVALCFTSSRVVVASCLLLCFTLVLLDQLRLQPWVYLYVLMLVPLVFGVQSRSVLFIYYRVIISGVYWWSGAHKINQYFLDGIYATWIEFFFDYQFSSAHDTVRLLGYGVGLVELLIGAGLLFKRSRNVMVVGAMTMHLFIIVFLLLQSDVPDTVVIPWNVAMILVDLFIFLGPELTSSGWSLKSRLVVSLGVALFWVCPALNFLGWWDHFLSFSLYSNKPPLLYVAIRQSDVGRIDSWLTRYFVDVPGMSGGQLLDVYWWAEDELNVPFYPERRVFKGLKKYFCALGTEEGSIVFVEISRKVGSGREVSSFTCGSLPR